MNRIISKEEEREDPRREPQSSFQLESKSVSSVSTYNPASFQSSRAKTTILHTELILLHEISKKYYNYKAHPVQINTRHLPVTVPHASKHSTWQNKAPGSPTALQAHMALAGFQLILPGRSSILSGSQHPRSPYSSSQARPTPQRSTWYYRILPGEIGFISKGSSIVCLCNTKVSVFQVTYSCTQNNSTGILILSRVLVILCEDTVHYLQSKLSWSQFHTSYSKMAMAMLESGPKLDWTRDNQMYECYRVWKKKVEFIFCSALADSTPKQLVSYLKYWMGDQGIPLIEKWESTGKLDYSNAEETPATDGGRRRILSSGYKIQTYWDLLDEEFKPKGNKLLSIIELWTCSKQGDKPLNQWFTQVYNLVNICKYPKDSTDRIIRDVLIVRCNSNHARDKII